MKKRIVSAALAVLMLSAVTACAGAKQADAPPVTTAATTVQAPTAALPSTTREQPSTTARAVTTVIETVTEIITTTKNLTTTKATTTAVPTTTLPLFDENKPLDYYKKVEKAFREDLKYGVFRRRSITSYIETLTDGTELTVKEEISEYYNRLFYSADFDDLLPAAKENMELYSDSIGTVLGIINGYRKKNGVSPLVLSNELTEIACARAEEIAWSGEHSHRRPNGRTCFTILKDAGINEGYAGENIGWGYDTAQEVCEAWKNSETHLKNILDPDFVEIGIGVAADPDPDGKLCWAQIFLGE